MHLCGKYMWAFYDWWTRTVPWRNEMLFALHHYLIIGQMTRIFQLHPSLGSSLAVTNFVIKNPHAKRASPPVNMWHTRHCLNRPHLWNQTCESINRFSRTNICLLQTNVCWREKKEVWMGFNNIIENYLKKTVMKFMENENLHLGSHIEWNLSWPYNVSVARAQSYKI